jgi:hypothetical protein
MANDTKARGIQLIRTDDSIPGIVRFYDRREANVQKAFIGQINVTELDEQARNRAAVHGVTQNVLDSSNKLTGDERVAFIKKACAHVQSGGWSAAPVDEAKQLADLQSALAKLPADVRAKFMASVKG